VVTGVGGARMGYITSRVNYSPTNNDTDLHPQNGKFTTLDEIIDKKIGGIVAGAKTSGPYATKRKKAANEKIAVNRALVASKLKRKSGTGGIWVDPYSGKFAAKFRNIHVGTFESYEEAESALADVINTAGTNPDLKTREKGRGSVWKQGGKFRAAYKGISIGMYGSEEEAEAAIREQIEKSPQ
jgi:hypothetical protein